MVKCFSYFTPGIFTVSDNAQETLWLELNAKVSQLYKQGKDSKAVKTAQKALKVAEEAFGPDHPNQATALSNLASLYKALGDFPKAEHLYKRVLAKREKLLGPSHPHLAKSMNDLALLYDYQGKYEEAEPLYKESLLIIENALGPDHPNVETVLKNLVGLYKSMDKEEEAQKYEERATNIHIKHLNTRINEERA